MIEELYHFIEANAVDSVDYLFILLLIGMFIDVITGVIASKHTGELSSSRGTFGLVKKILIILLLLYFVAVAPVLPGDFGLYAVYTALIGQIFIELLSIKENYDKLGIKSDVFSKIFKDGDDK